MENVHENSKSDEFSCQIKQFYNKNYKIMLTKTSRLRDYDINTMGTGENKIKLKYSRCLKYGTQNLDKWLSGF